MTSLPMPAGWPETITPPGIADLAKPCDQGELTAEDHACLAKAHQPDQQFLAWAFRSFSEVARSLERSYAALQEEVERLRRELEESRTGLERSLEDNRAMRAQLDRILEGLPCGVLVVDHAGVISRANPEALRLLLDPGAKQVAPDGFADLPETVRGLCEQSRHEQRECEASMAPGSDEAVWLAVRYAAIPGASGDSVFLLRDASEGRRLRAVEDKLRRDQALAELAGVLAHEVRNPLASLELFAGLLAESAADAQSREWAGQVQAGLRSLAATVNNVLHFHTLSAGQVRAALIPVDLGELLAWAHDFFLPLARQSRVALGLQNRLQGTVLAGDRARLEQVLANLVLNAVRAMPQGGWIELGGYPRDHEAVLTVSDNGPGIAASILPRIFEAGFSTRPASPGLGLAVSRRIVEQHGGSITASSPAGRGAIFTLRFPLSSGVADAKGEVQP